MYIFIIDVYVYYETCVCVHLAMYEALFTLLISVPKSRTWKMNADCAVKLSSEVLGRQLFVLARLSQVTAWSFTKKAFAETSGFESEGLRLAQSNKNRYSVQTLFQGLLIPNSEKVLGDVLEKKLRQGNSTVCIYRVYAPFLMCPTCPFQNACRLYSKAWDKQARQARQPTARCRPSGLKKKT